MQQPGHKVNLAKTQAEVRLTTGLEESTQPDLVAKSKGDQTTQQEVRIPTQTDMDVSLDEGFADRMLDQNTDTHTGTAAAGSDTQSETRQKTRSGELSSLEKHHDPDHTVGCNTCQEDLIDAINDQCRINVGDIIASRYEIKTYLGEGGMSAVYAANDKVIKREVALKILHRDLLVRGKGSLLRFQREAQALGNLDHPNIVKIHHFDADENAQPYIVMDIVRGDSLARRLVKDADSVKFSDIIDIFVQVCDALAHAHSRGVVHRDLKPSNIMVVGNQVKVLDFGIAKLMSEDSDQELQLTRTGEVFGSPLYMSPEQCRGLKLDFRSDIYSIGCVMYEAFTGSPPFTGNSHIDTMLKHVNDLPASVSTSVCDARYVEKVDAILLRCMAKNPAARFQSMDEVKSALLELERETRGPIERLKQKLELMRLKVGAQGKFTKKMIAAYCAAGLVFAGLATTAVVQHNNAGLSVSVKTPNMEYWKELDAKGQQEFDKGNYAQAEATFNTELSVAKTLKNKQLKAASIMQMLDLLNAQAVLEPSVLKNSGYQKRLATAKEELALVQKEQLADFDALKKQLDESGSLAAPEKEELGNLALDSVLTLNAAGKYDDAIDLAKRVVALSEQSKNQVLLGKAYFTIGNVYENRHDIKAARESYEKSLALREKVLSANDFDIARVLVTLSRVMPNQKDYEKLERAKAICTRAFSPTSHQVGWIEMIMAQTDIQNQNYKRALQRAESAISKCKNSLETELSMEEQTRAKLSLMRAYAYRALAKRFLLAEDLKANKKVAQKDEIEASIGADFAQALRCAEDLNPKPNTCDIDMLLSWLLVQDSDTLKQAYEVATSKTEKIPTDSSGKPILLNEAKVRLARAIAINERVPGSEAAQKETDYYVAMAKLGRSLLDPQFAERMYLKAKEWSDREFGAQSAKSQSIQNDLEILRRDFKNSKS